jgi:hypothetical protein
MDENQLEDIIERYPELIEEGLILLGRQVYLNGDGRNYIDMLFKDRSDCHLIMELKISQITSEHIAQIKKYKELYKALQSDKTRIMLVGKNISKSMKQLLDLEKIEYKELKMTDIKLFLKKKEDHVFLRYFDENNPKKRKQRKRETKVQRSERVGVLTGRNIWNSRGGTMQNHFCKFVIEAGNKGVSMDEAKDAPWNKRGYHFNETVERLIKKEYIKERGSRYYVTKKGMENLFT